MFSSSLSCLHYSRASDTVLGESADKTELFLVDECDDMEAATIEGKAKVVFHEQPTDWFDIGGLVEGKSPIPDDEEDSYFYQKWSVLLYYDY